MDGGGQMIESRGAIVMEIGASRGAMAERG